MNQQCVNDIIGILETARAQVFLRSERERTTEEDFDAHHETAALIVFKIDKIIAECSPSISDQMTSPLVPPGMVAPSIQPPNIQPLDMGPPGMPPISSLHTNQITIGQLYQSLYPDWQQTAQQLQVASDSFRR